MHEIVTPFHPRDGRFHVRRQSAIGSIANKTNDLMSSNKKAQPMQIGHPITPVVTRICAKPSTPQLEANDTGCETIEARTYQSNLAIDNGN